MEGRVRSHTRRNRLAAVAIGVSLVLIAAGAYALFASMKVPPSGGTVGAPITLGNVSLIHSGTAVPGCGSEVYCYRLSFESIPIGAKSGNLTFRIVQPNGTLLVRNVSTGATLLTQEGSIVVSSLVPAGMGFNISNWPNGNGSANLSVSMVLVISVGLGWNPEGAGLSLVSGLDIRGQSSSTNSLP